MALPDARGVFESAGDPEAESIYARIYELILEHRLTPGTKLPEEKLAAIFDVNRAKIRKVLARLEHERIVEAFPNRGAFVSQPSVAEASDTLAARRVIEPAIVRQLARQSTPADMNAIRAHIADEFQAFRDDDKPAVIRLAGEFHNIVADLAGNTALSRMLRELTALTCLTILLYDAPTATACLPDDHVLLADAIERHDETAAEEVMLRHLQAVEDSLVFDKDADAPDLEAIFGSVPQKMRPQPVSRKRSRATAA